MVDHLMEASVSNDYGQILDVELSYRPAMDKFVHPLKKILNSVALSELQQKERILDPISGILHLKLFPADFFSLQSNLTTPYLQCKQRP